MTRRRLQGLLVSLVLAPVLLLLGAVVAREETSGPDAAGAQARPAARAEVASPSADVTGTVASLRARVAEVPADDTSWASLGFALVTQARSTGDPSQYLEAERAFARSLEERPEGNAPAVAGQALLANARHDFPEARRLAQAAVDLDPYDPTPRGLLADALFELGDYEAGRRVLQEMVDLRPGVPSLTRVSYSYELRGDLDGAAYALDRALALASSPADAAFARLHLAQLAWSVGDYDRAAVQIAQGLKRAPDDVPLLAWRAKVAAARGYPDAALRHYEQVVQRQPEPVHLVEYGELLESLGRVEEARAQYDVAEAASVLYDQSGVLPDVEVVLYQADHGDPERALELARAQYETRRSVHVEAALAWALHVNGKDREALQHAEAARRLGTRNALWDYQRGVIQAELGLVEEARASLTAALEGNPAFSPLHAPRARSALAALGGAG